MYILERLKQIFFSPIVHLPAGPLTLGSITLALFIILLSRLVAVGAGRGLTRLLAHRGVDDSARFAMAKIARYCIVLIGILVAFTSIGLKLDALFAASAALLVGIGFGLQTIAQNFISGLILLIERPVGKGDFVQIGSAHGSVVDIGLRATTVVTRDEVTIIVPNSELITGQVVNHSIPTTRRRIAITVGVAYGSDLELVKRLLLDVAAREKGLLPEPAPEVRLEAFGAYTLDFALLVWIAEPSQDLRVASNVRFAIEASFRQHRVEIPFPQRELRLHGGFAGQDDALRPGATKPKVS
jgi:small-conductance mechanosensitive channel